MKKILPGLLLAGVVASAPAIAFADNGKHLGWEKQPKIEFRHAHHDFAKATLTKKVAKVEASQIKTYSDVSIILASYASTTNSLRFNATTSATSTLSGGELVLYSALKPGGKKPEMVNVQADKIIARINNLQTLVAPLSSQSVSETFGLKNLIVREINSIGASINALAKLSGTIK